MWSYAISCRFFANAFPCTPCFTLDYKCYPWSAALVHVIGVTLNDLLFVRKVASVCIILLDDPFDVSQIEGDQSNLYSATDISLYKYKIFLCKLSRYDLRMTTLRLPNQIMQIKSSSAGREEFIF